MFLYIEEKGDLQEGFRSEKLLIDPEINSNDGIVYIKMNHLTAVGLGTEIMTSIDDDKKKDNDSSEDSSNCFLEAIRW